MGILCIMLGLFFLSLSMKKAVKEQSAEELPKIKGPKVLIPKKKEPADGVQITGEQDVEHSVEENTDSATINGQDTSDGQTGDSVFENSSGSEEGVGMPE